MASGPITSWQVVGETVEVLIDFLFLGSRITVIADCSQEIRCLLLVRKAVTHLDSILKSKDISLLTKVCIIKVMVFPVVLYGRENWTIQIQLSTEELILLNCSAGEDFESPLNCKEIKPVNPKGNQPWIFVGRTDAWSWSSYTLATWCQEPAHWKRLWCWKRLKAKGEGDNREWDGWMASPTQWTWIWAKSGRQWRTEKPVHGVACPWGCKSGTQLSNWTTAIISLIIKCAGDCSQSFIEINSLNQGTLKLVLLLSPFERWYKSDTEGCLSEVSRI